MLTITNHTKDYWIIIVFDTYTYGPLNMLDYEIVQTYDLYEQLLKQIIIQVDSKQILCYKYTINTLTSYNAVLYFLKLFLSYILYTIAHN